MDPPEALLVHQWPEDFAVTEPAAQLAHHEAEEDSVLSDWTQRLDEESARAELERLAGGGMPRNVSSHGIDRIGAFRSHSWGFSRHARSGGAVVRVFMLCPPARDSHCVRLIYYFYSRGIHTSASL